LTLEEFIVKKTEQFLKAYFELEEKVSKFKGIPIKDISIKDWVQYVKIDETYELQCYKRFQYGLWLSDSLDDIDIIIESSAPKRLTKLLKAYLDEVIISYLSGSS
jgi:recombinational DNA repair protein RecR